MLVGIAGYMGAGKSEAARILVSRGYTVIDADREARELMQRDQEIHDRVEATFGPDVFDGDALVAARLGPRAFASEEAMAKLNAIVHPPLRQALEKRLSAQPGRDTVLDAALLPLLNWSQQFGLLLWIHAPASLRLQRIVQRTGLGRDETAARMALQERMMPEPQSPPWVRLANEHSRVELRRRLEEAMGSAGHPHTQASEST